MEFDSLGIITSGPLGTLPEEMYGEIIDKIELVYRLPISMVNKIFRKMALQRIENFNLDQSPRLSFGLYQKMIKNGDILTIIRYKKFYNIIDINFLLADSFSYNYIPIIKWIIENKNVQELNQRNQWFILGECYCNAARNGDLELLSIILDLIKKYNPDLVSHSLRGWKGACIGGHLEIARKTLDLIDFAIEDKNHFLNIGISNAAFYGHENICVWLINQATKLSLIDVVHGTNNKNILEMFLRKGANDYDRCFEAACYKKDKEIMKRMLDLGAFQYSIIPIGMFACASCKKLIVNHDVG